jgi:hypothetical protein
MKVSIFRAICFHFNRNKLPFLKETLAASFSRQYELTTVVTTNSNTETDLNDIASCFTNLITSNSHYEITTFPNLSNPWLLPWTHKQLMKTAFESGLYTHYIYTEDDIRLSEDNILSWIQLNASIGNYNSVYPSFVRVEFCKVKKKWFYTDQRNAVGISSSNFIEHTFHSNRIRLYELSNPYQAMFIYDNNQMEEYINSQQYLVQHCKSLTNICHPTWGGGGVAEDAAYGLTFKDPISPFRSRNLLPIDTYYRVPLTGFLIHHLTNSYRENHTNQGFATLGLDDLFLA